MPNNPEGNRDFEIRFGRAATSKKLAVVPTTGIVQVTTTTAVAAIANITASAADLAKASVVITCCRRHRRQRQRHQVNTVSHNTRVCRRGLPAEPESTANRSLELIKRTPEKAPPTDEDVSGWLHQANMVANELVSTEENYVEVLRVLNENFLIPLKSWAEDMENGVEGAGGAALSSGGGSSRQTGAVTCVSSAEVQQMIGGVDGLLMIHTELLEKLRAARDSQRAEGEAGHAALCEALGKELEDAANGGMEYYKVHIPGYEKMRETALKLRAERSQYRFAVEMLERVPPAQSLGALLINTVTRLPRYMLLCREIIKNLEKLEEAERAGISVPNQAGVLGQATDQVTAAFEAVRDVTSTTNERIAQAERKQQAHTLCQTLGVPNVPSREYIQESSTMQKLRRAKGFFGGKNSLNRSERTTYLFTDSVVVTKGNKKSDTYIFMLKDLIVVSDEVVYGDATGLRECWHLTPIDRVLTGIGMDTQLFTDDDMDRSFVVSRGEEGGKGERGGNAGGGCMRH